MKDYRCAGLTGGIASGKSTVSALFKKWGALVIDADEISRGALEKDGPCFSDTVEAFGESILREDGEIDRRALGALVFSDESKRQRLNGIIHPYVEREIERRSAEAYAAEPARLILWDVPLLLESASGKKVDKILVVTAEEKLRISRICKRDKLSPAEAVKRIRSQMPETQKRLLADYVIENNGSLKELKQQAREVYERLRTELC